MLDLTIERLNLDLSDATGQEHRVQPIVARAMALLGERLVGLGDAANEPSIGRVDELAVPPVRMDLSRTSDEAVAGRVADAVFEAIKIRLGV